MSLPAIFPSGMTLFGLNVLKASRSMAPYPLFGKNKHPRLQPPLQQDLFAPRQKQSRLDQKSLNRFAVIGDAGVGEESQFAVGKQMYRTYEKKPFASVLVLGDNIYEDGEPKFFHDRIYRPYKKLFKKDVRFYPVMGNHDVRKGHGAEQLKYWGAPATGFYNFKLGQPGNEVELFALDTTVMLPGYDGCYTDAPFLAKQLADVQLKWLDKALGDSTAKYKIVFGHYPLYSSGMHSNREDITLKLRQLLEPLFQKYHVNAYLAGHEHHYERSAPIEGITHFVSGAAGKIRRIFFRDNPSHLRDVAHKKYHFMLFEVTPKGLKYQVIGRKGKILDEGLLKPKKRKELLAS